MKMGKIIKYEMEKPGRDLKDKDISKLLGLSKSMICNVIHDRDTLLFHDWLKFIKTLCPEREIELVGLFFEDEINGCGSTTCRRTMMEYFSINNEIENLETLVTLETKSHNRENKDWAKAYKLVLQYLKAPKPSIELLNCIEEYSPTYKIPSIIKKILTVYVCYHLGHYKMMFDTALRVESCIKEITNFYLKECLTVRISEMLSNAYLFAKADCEKSRFYAKNVINSNIICARFKLNLYYNMGLSYLFEDYDLFNVNMKNYISELKKLNLETRIKYVINNDFAFANTYWGKDGHNQEEYDMIEKAHFEARRGDKNKALELLLQVKKKDEPFYKCYKGMVTSNPLLITESMRGFEQDGNKFFATLPYRELKNYEQYKDIAEMLYKTIKIA